MEFRADLVRSSRKSQRMGMPGLLALCFVVITCYFYGCGSSRESINFTEVAQGAHLAQAKEIALDTFLMIWIQNEQHGKIDVNLNELYHDESFTYFGKQNLKDQQFYKINNAALARVDYQSIIGDSIRQKFYEEIIPLADRNKQHNCSSASINFQYSYRFLESENAIEIKCRYKVVCEFIARIVNQDYVAKYDFRTHAYTHPHF